MFDLALNEKGDIIFEQNMNKSKPMKISFIVSKASVLKINFKIEDCIPLTAKNSIKLSFDISNSRFNKKALLLQEYDSTIQAIKIRLQTSLGDIVSRPTIGSSLETIKHKPLYDIGIQTKAIKLVKESIADILPSAEVIVKPMVSRTIHGYSQKLVIYIYDNNMLIFKYDLKE